MNTLLKWELKQTFTSKSFWIIGASMIVFPALLLLLTLHFAPEYTGGQAFLEGLNNFNAFVIFLMGVFAGIHVTGAFENRKIQAAVMAGNSRFDILMAKFLSFAAAIAVYSITSIPLSTAIAFGMQGTNGLDGSFLRAVLVRALIFIIVEIAYSAICFLASMFIKHQGGAIGLNLVLMLMFNVIAQILICFDWSYQIIRFTPVGQSMILPGDISSGNIAVALTGCIVTFAGVIALSYAKFRNQELK